MAGIHGLEHVERFFTANLTDDDAIRAHTQRVHQQLALANGAFAFHVGRSGFEPDHVFLTKLKLGRVFDRHDAIAVRDE